MNSPDETTRLKEVEFYAANLGAWLNTSLEHDKSILTLSAGGIGLLVTLLTAVGVKSEALVYLYSAAIGSFLLSLAAVLAVFRRNRNHIENVFSGKPEKDSVLTDLDHASIGLFGLGAILTAIIGVSTAVASNAERESKMATENRAVQPDQLLHKSFNGVGALQPGAQAPAQPAPAEAPAPAPAQPSAQQSQGGQSR